MLALFALSDADMADGGEGFKIVKGEGTICAAGNGAIQFHGSGNLAVKGRGGQLIISDESAVVMISGKGRKHVFPNGWVMYVGFNGKAQLEGEDMFGQIIGKGVRMKADGEGVMLLMGKGVYRVPCDAPESSWKLTLDGVGIELNDYTEYEGDLEEMD